MQTLNKHGRICWNFFLDNTVCIRTTVLFQNIESFWHLVPQFRIKSLFCNLQQCYHSECFNAPCTCPTTPCSWSFSAGPTKFDKCLLINDHNRPDNPHHSYMTAVNAASKFFPASKVPRMPLQIIRKFSMAGCRAAGQAHISTNIFWVKNTYGCLVSLRPSAAIVSK